MNKILKKNCKKPNSNYPLFTSSKKITTALGQCSGYIQEFEWVEEVTLAVAEREKVKERFIHATYLIVLQGWVDAEEKQNLMHVLNETVSEEDIYVSFETPNSEEIQQEVPTKLKTIRLSNLLNC